MSLLFVNPSTLFRLKRPLFVNVEKLTIGPGDDKTETKSLFMPSATIGVALRSCSGFGLLWLITCILSLSTPV